MTVLVPNVYGGGSGGTLDSSSELYKELKKNGAQVGKEVQTYTYWGDKIFTSGPVYFGALVCFLFVLGMFVIRNPMKWWLLAGSVFLTFLALGRNFDSFNDLMFHYLPLYNKFRTVEMALVQQPAEMYKETVADKAILQDAGSTFRVLNINNPWQETNTSYFHHSIGGYHAVKLRRYQELIDHRLDGELRGIIGALQKAQTAEDVMSALAACPTLNMLNTRYVIYNPEQQPLKNPYAFGNAWFVDKLDMVDNADAEIEALNTIDPLRTAVVDKRFQEDLEGFVPQKDSTATIVLEEYRPNRLTYKSKADKEQLAVFSEVYYQPGWKATVDGKEVPHFRADWILRGMRVPAGEHTIVFEFRPSGYVTAAYVSSYSSFLILLLLIAAIGWSGWKYWKKSKN